jgi:predicted NBD/HSP70 family sugar kinase
MDESTGSPDTPAEAAPLEKPRAERKTKVLVIDVGGTHVKALVTGAKTPIKIDSGPTMTASKMATGIRKAVAQAGWRFNAVSIGYPGPVRLGQPLKEPHNLGGGWRHFDFKKAFGCPVKVLNDAGMQALGSYTGGRMLFLGLGTGLGTAIVSDGVLDSLELAHLPYKGGKTFEDFTGARGLKRLGKRKWRRHVKEVVAILAAALKADYTVLGGGNAKLMKKLPAQTRLGSNAHAFLGGFRLWRQSKQLGE